ncbi:hypothetical protein [Lactobacillus mulieris]|uniref:PTS cellobiose transporter subunit IIC n=1 Tax=Lactobacillus mulieris TaxID=2508708 RepID=A0ABT4K1L4_9LACO|nr:hypothetical protein [Lactobacillus mulieris]MCZ3622014.1 hypothetical protein [Lactobacillus mulieris]MCZ3623711.1 hypothetical protein [Lactobacillus mulieris]MCZ3636021.1 hypothetical protein [Lactobacillus mulieris]
MAKAESKKEFKEKSLYYNRYFSLRYLTAGYFFVNFWWLIVLAMGGSEVVLLPLALLLLCIPAIWEQKKKFDQREGNELPQTKHYYLFQVVINILLGICYFTSAFSFFYPFVDSAAFSFLFMLLLLGLAIGIWSLHHISQIERNEDKFFRRYEAYARQK